jgi:predicted nucleic acid-binding protein
MMGSHGGGPFVLEDPHPREAVRMLENEEIKVLTLEEVVDELIQSIEEEMKEYEKERTGRVGKLEDPVMALLRELVRKKKLGKFLLSRLE